jgi:hypothetical protein
VVTMKLTIDLDTLSVDGEYGETVAHAIREEIRVAVTRAIRAELAAQRTQVQALASSAVRKVITPEGLDMMIKKALKEAIQC